MPEHERGQVLGIGGIFFRARDSQTLGQWYSDTLGMAVESWGSTQGTTFQPDQMPAGAYTVWAAFAADTDYFGGSGQQHMINLVVDDLDAALNRVAAAGAEVIPEREVQEYGSFGWFVDPDGNRVELWQPPDVTPES